MQGEKEIVELLEKISSAERRRIFDHLRRQFLIHELEQRLNVSAEVILEAISRASDLTLRGVRGIIAEAAFKQEVILPGIERGEWEEVALSGDHPFDFAVVDKLGRINIQVKMQRQKQQRPMLASEANRKLFSKLDTFYVVETQRTRAGKAKDGAATRPYRFGEFDILAVAMHPSTGNWSDFLYTVERWLLPTPGQNTTLFKFQPVPRQKNENWTDDIAEAIQWLRSGENRVSDVSRIEEPGQLSLA